ncbi:MAG: SGNH/GDSL hydrolase family protein [Microbacterium sp.]
MRRFPRVRALIGLLAIGVGLSACAAGQPTPPLADGDGPVVAFYGDSYTLGTGASDPSLRWSSIVSAERGWREFNPSVNGLGFVNNRTSAGDGDLPDQIIEQNPDIVFVTMGLNDNFSFDRAGDRIHSAIRDDLTRLRTALPDARFVVVEPFWYTAERPESVETIIGWVREEAEAIDADWIAGASRWLDGHYAGDAESWMAADGLHPDDTGYAEMAERMDAALRALDPAL